MKPNQLLLLALFFTLFLFTFNFAGAQSVTSPDTVCAGSTVSYATSGASGNQFFWSLKNGTARGTIAATSSADSVRITWLATAGTDTLRVVEMNTDSCYGDTVTLAIFIQALPTATLAGVDTICVNNATTGQPFGITFTGSAPWTVAYTENGVARNVSTSANPYKFNSQVYTATGSKPYALTSVSDGNGCVATLSGTGTVLVQPKPSSSAIRHY
jgi:hypothetical protein